MKRKNDVVYEVEDDDDMEMPPSFKMAMHPGYLGSPAVVERLLAEAAQSLHQLLSANGAGAITQEQFLKIFRERGVEFSRIFSGQHPDYPGIAGWNSPTAGLQMYLRTDLSTYWHSQHAKYDDDAYQVLYAYLLWSVGDAFKRASGDIDDPIFEVLLGTTLKKVAQILLGTAKRH